MADLNKGENAEDENDQEGEDNDHVARLEAMADMNEGEDAEDAEQRAMLLQAGIPLARGDLARMRAEEIRLRDEAQQRQLREEQTIQPRQPLRAPLNPLGEVRLRERMPPITFPDLTDPTEYQTILDASFYEVMQEGNLRRQRARERREHRASTDAIFLEAMLQEAEDDQPQQARGDN